MTKPVKKAWSQAIFGMRDKSRMPPTRKKATIGGFLLISIFSLIIEGALSSGIPKVGLEHIKRKGKKLRVLYTITTLSEYDLGTRSTTRGYDRLMNTLVPVAREGVLSMVDHGYDVDVVLICHYEMKPEREEKVRSLLPKSVNLTVWNSAAPIAYSLDDKKNVGMTIPSTRALARQHRFIIKDKLLFYDMFCSFEDDMVVKGYHIDNYIDMTKHLYELRRQAPETVSTKQGSFYGSLTKSQLKRMMPGLMRVEVLLDESRYGTQMQKDPVPISAENPQVDPIPCCHMTSRPSGNISSVNPSRPAAPTSDKLFLWETGILALGVREMPNLLNPTNESAPLGWVMFQRGPRVNQEQKEVDMGDYWSGTDGYFGASKKRPMPGQFDFVNNQGGWMATRQQIWEWHTEICPGGLLPPFGAPHYNLDGLDLRNVEYWSGGLNLFTARHACNLQRIVSLSPQRFSRQLLYHSANNKQRQLVHRRSAFVKMNDLLGQLWTVRDNAARKKENEQKEQ